MDTWRTLYAKITEALHASLKGKYFHLSEEAVLRPIEEHIGSKQSLVPPTAKKPLDQFQRRCAQFKRRTKWPRKPSSVN